MKKSMLTFEFVMIMSLLVMNASPQELKPIILAVLWALLLTTYLKCYKEAT